ncbi:MAG: SDR family oxidoreductase [Pseudomonadota bacterium]
MELDGKVALITGSAQGLGAAVARRFRKAGATLYVTDVNETDGRAVADEVSGRFLALDVADEVAWREVIGYVGRESRRLDVLVNNAGVEGNTSAPKDPEHGSLADWEAIFRVNMLGTFLGCKHALQLINNDGGGAIVNFSSVASLLPTPFITAYGASKAAVEHFSRSLALYAAQQGYHVRCNTVHPGQVLTPMLHGLFDRMAADADTTPSDFAAQFKREIPLGEFQEPEDIANAVLFLASDSARFITGQSLVIDGGFTLSH